MNYHTIYTQLVTKRQNILTEGYTEKHHIIPRCMGGTNEPENLVRLTAREHFIAHQLLVKMFNHNKLIHAINIMSNLKRYGSKKYEWIRKKYQVENKRRKNRKGSKHTEETKLKMSESHKGKKDTPETTKKRSESQKGKIIPPEQKQKMSESHKGRKFTEEHRRKLSESHKGQVPPNKGKPGKPAFNKGKKCRIDPDTGKRIYE